MFQRDEGDKQNHLLVIQCDSGHLNGDLIACARYRVYDERVNALNKFHSRDGVTHVLFVINLPHQVSSSTFVGFQGDPWISSHIDDLRPTSSDTIEPLHAIATNISELFIGEYIHDIAPLLDTTLSRQSSLSNYEKSLDLYEEVSTQEMLVYHARGVIEVEGEGGHQMLPDPQAVCDAGGDTDVEDEGDKSEGEYQVQPLLQAMHDADGGANVEGEAEEGHQLHPEPQAENSSPQTSHNAIEEIAEIPEQPFEPTAVSACKQHEFQEKEDESAVGPYQENSGHLESVGTHRHQALQTHKSVEDKPEALTSINESVALSQAVLPVEPEVPKTTDIIIHALPHKSEKRQHPSGQCRRIYSCIQAAASRLEDSTKDRSTQRVARLTKLIQKSPDHFSKRDT